MTQKIAQFRQIITLINKTIETKRVTRYFLVRGKNLQKKELQLKVKVTW